jgi:hypothetical protein
MIWEEKNYHIFVYDTLSVCVCVCVCVCRGYGKYTRLWKLFAFKEIIRVFEKYSGF